MARYTGPRKKYEKRFGLLPGVQARAVRRRKSDYGIRLDEKQKLKFIYGVTERQFRRYFEMASRDPANTGEVLLRQLEMRLDNVVYRMGFARTRRQARQLVNHGHVLVDGSKVDIPSYNVKVGQTVTLKATTLENPQVKEYFEKVKQEDLPSWIRRKGPVGKVERLPEGKDLRSDVDVNLIAEFYSR